MNKHFSGCEIVELGIQIEVNGRDFYTELSKAADDPDLRKVFEELARQEDDHIAAFKNIFSSTCEYEPKGAYPEEYFAYMNAMAGDHVFTQKGKGTEIAKSVKDNKEGIELGIGFEKDSILFYEEMKKYIPEKDASLVDKIIGEEKKHLKRLQELKEDM